MTAPAPRPDAATFEELAERAHDARTDYPGARRAHSGPHYDEAEQRSRQRLQDRLRRLDDRRAELAGGDAGTRGPAPH